MKTLIAKIKEKMETIKLKVKELRDVACPNCDGKGGWTECHGDLIYDGDCGLSEYIDCERCDKKGELEVEIEHCKKCGEELCWNDDEAGFDEDTETFYRCLTNECDRQIKEVAPSKEPSAEVPF